MSYIEPYLPNVWPFFAALGGILLMTAYAKWSNNNADAASVNAENTKVGADLTALQASNEYLRNGGDGQAGEKALRQAVSMALTEMGVGFSNHFGAGLNDAIILPRNGSPFSREIDLLLVCEFGVYVFEAKDWEGKWKSSEEKVDLNVIYPNGLVGSRKDPLPKTMRKVRDISDKLTNKTHCRAVVVNTDPLGSFHHTLPSDFLRISEIPYFLRLERDSLPKIQNYEETLAEVFAQLDHSPNAKHDHMMRLTPSEENIREYQANHAEIVRLSSQPRIGYSERRRLMGWMVSGVLSLFGAYAAFAAMPTPSAIVPAGKVHKVEQASDTATQVAPNKKPAKKARVKHQASQ